MRSLILDHGKERPQDEKRVLLVDDEPRIRELCKMFLESRDYQVDLAADGEEALYLFNKKRYGLLITDHLMPRLSGLDLVRLLRSNGHCIPTLLISGDLPVHEPDLALLLGAGALLAKPFAMSQFLAAVDGVLEIDHEQHEGLTSRSS